MTKELIDHIKENFKKGYAKETLKYALIKQGYPRITIERSLKKAEEEINKESSEKIKEKPKEKPKIRYEIYDQNDNIVEVYESKKSIKNNLLSRFKGLFKRQ